MELTSQDYGLGTVSILLIKKINAAMDINLPIFMQTEKWLEEYFLRKEPFFTPTIELQGTAFQICIWKLLAAIPYGKCKTYGTLAGEVSYLLRKQRMSAQAVGRAISCNPICIIIPCHSVIGADGSLTGYSGGIRRKAELLKLEGVSDI